MPRFPRPWSKKRGERLLSGTMPGVVGEIAFLAFLFLIGIFVLSLVLIDEFAPAQVPQVPTDAFDSDLSLWVFGVLSVAAIITGGVGLAMRLTKETASDERRSVIAKRAGEIEAEARELIGRTGEFDDNMPGIPKGSLLTDSPGERLTYRLAAELPDQTLVGTAILALLWDAAWLVLLAVSIMGFASGQPRWILTMLLLPFGAIGVWSSRMFLTRLRTRIGVGPTIVEISDHPLFAGQQYQVYVAQSGRIRIGKLTVQLICEEESFYSQGTDLRIERHETFQHTLCKHRNIVVDSQTPWEQQLEFDLPENAMHSFVAPHNAIRWKIVVQGESRPWPSFCRSFPVIVHPPDLPPKPSRR